MTETTSNPAVVIVDDEEIVLNSISSFLSLETEYQVETFLSASKALEFVQSQSVGVIVSDFLMPEMDGIALLGKAREIKPEVPRIILTGYADKENAIKAINDIGLFQYIEKPWDNNDLLLIIRNALEKYSLSARLSSKLEEINKAYGDLQRIQNEIVKTFV